MPTTAAPPGPVSPSAPGGSSRSVPVLVAVTAAVALLLGIGGTLLLRPGGSDSAVGTAPGPSGTPTAAPSTSASAGASAGASGVPTGQVFRYQPLWPFGSPADAVAWQRSAGGSQPWRLDPELTALTFTWTQLGFDQLRTVTSRQVVGDEAWVGVGPGAPSGGTAAVLHLAQIGAGAHRPWEVVGSRDTTLTLTTPAYGVVVRGSPLTVGGRITGVDESLVVQVRAPDGTVLGTGPATPAGGSRTPWSVAVPLDLTRPGVATVVVATGGHVAEVERFALTAVRLPGLTG